MTAAADTGPSPISRMAVRCTSEPDLRWQQGPREGQPLGDHVQSTTAPAGGELVLSTRSGPSSRQQGETANHRSELPWRHRSIKIRSLLCERLKKRLISPRNVGRLLIAGKPWVVGSNQDVQQTRLPQHWSRLKRRLIGEIKWIRLSHHSNLPKWSAIFRARYSYEVPISRPIASCYTSTGQLRHAPQSFSHTWSMQTTRERLDKRNSKSTIHQTVASATLQRLLCEKRSWRVECRQSLAGQRTKHESAVSAHGSCPSVFLVCTFPSLLPKVGLVRIYVTFWPDV